MLRFLLPALLVAATPAAAFDPYNLPNRTSQMIRRLVEFTVILDRCPQAVPTKNARLFWKDVRGEYRHVPDRLAADEPKLKAHIRSEIAKARREPVVGGPALWCERAKRYYGPHGVYRTNGIAMRDGSDTTPKCVLDGSCSAADTLRFEFY